MLLRRCPLRRIGMGSFNPFVANERKHGGGKVPVDYLTCWMLFLPRLHEFLG